MPESTATNAANYTTPRDTIGKAFEVLEPLREIVSADEVSEMATEFVVSSSA